jgi:lipopolysaccharide export system protein LptA
LVIDATNRILRANGQARLKMAGQTFGTFGAHNAPATPAPVTNHYVEINSDSYELGTNSASFRKNVRAREWAAEQVRSTLNCGELTAWYSGTNQLQRMVAEQGVVIEQQDEQLRAGRAVYTSTNGLLELTDQPTWRSGPREGRGERMAMVVPENELSVQGDAYLKLPANEAGRTAGPGTGAVVTNQFAELFSEQYVVRPQVALFEGKVRLAHPQLQMTCDHLAVHSAADKQTGQNLTAEHSVVFDLLSSDGEKVHGTCQKAFYDYSIRGGQTNDVLELTGNPILETTNGSVQNSMLILDRARNKLLVPSVEQVRKANPGTESRRYRIALAVGAIPTNRFPMLRK